MRLSLLQLLVSPFLMTMMMHLSRTPATMEHHLELLALCMLQYMFLGLILLTFLDVDLTASQPLPDDDDDDAF